MNHFGHFITETLTAIPVEAVDNGEVRGIVAHASLPARPGPPPAWRDRLAELAGLPQRRHIVTTGDCFPERLMFARRRLVLNAFARPGATALWNRIRDAVAPDARTDDRVFLSRRRFEDSLAPAGVSTRNHRASVAWDVERLEASFERAGFRIVHPETLSIDDQIRTVANAASSPAGAGPRSTSRHSPPPTRECWSWAISAAGPRPLPISGRSALHAGKRWCRSPPIRPARRHRTPVSIGSSPTSSEKTVGAEPADQPPSTTRWCGTPRSSSTSESN